ncbi:hypothetical protein HUJ04_001923 [Dendroctonus ponderosae]|uniref:SAM-dependent MTase RsmB/NOP-type domain-containing protein n=1 Tax=Dendroctonus ponderosae TaxID=77166 RepID=A0AAR5QJ16_DENPD|nr:hypothetical protein HUJ04_001923 [Dendroctonus ponderosae]
MEKGQFNHSVKVPKLYKCAAKIIEKVTEGAGSIKQLVYEKTHFNTKALFALVMTTFQKTNEINLLLKRTQLLDKEPRLDPCLAKILISELVWGKKQLPRSDAKPILTILAYEQAFHAHLSDSSGEFSSESKSFFRKPRYIRINTLKTSVNEALELFQDEGWILLPKPENCSYSTYLQQVSSLEDGYFLRDYHVPDMLVFPTGTEFHNHPGYKKGVILLQDKASCLPVLALSPQPGSVCLDMCAAPGMKTTQIASLMENSGTIFAVERSAKRFEVLQRMIDSSGATCVTLANKDVLHCSDTDFPKVDYILVDPSCSGSGMTNRLEVCTEPMNNPDRLQQLAGFQIMILRSALTRYPNAKRVVYSTCSLNPEENEDVVRQVLETNNQYKLLPAGDFLQNNWTNFGSSSFGKIGQYCLYARPEDDLTNGFFLAVFQRLAEDEENEFYNNRASRYITNMQKNKTRRENRNLQSADSTGFPRKMDSNQERVEPKDKLDNWRYDYEQGTADEWRESEESGRGPGTKSARVDVQLRLINGRFDKGKADNGRSRTDELCTNEEDEPFEVKVKVEEFASGERVQKSEDTANSAERQAMKNRAEIKAIVEEFVREESTKSKRKKDKDQENCEADEHRKAKRHKSEDSIEGKEASGKVDCKTSKLVDLEIMEADEEIANDQRKKGEESFEDYELEGGTEKKKKSKRHKSEEPSEYNEEGGNVERKKSKSNDLDAQIADEELGSKKKKKSKRTKKEQSNETREDSENFKGEKDVEIITVEEESPSKKKKKSKRTKREESSETREDSETFKGEKDAEIITVEEESPSETKKQSKRTKKEESSESREDSEKFKGKKDVEIIVVDEEGPSEKKKKSKRTKRDESSETREHSESFKGKKDVEIIIVDEESRSEKKNKSKRTKKEESSETREDSENFKSIKDVEIIIAEDETPSEKKKKSKRTKKEESSESWEDSENFKGEKAVEIITVEEESFTEKKKKSKRTKREESSETREDSENFKDGKVVEIITVEEESPSEKKKKSKRSKSEELPVAEMITPNGENKKRKKERN